MSRVHDRELRRDWIHRIHDHDGLGEEAGGIERWLMLTDGLGLTATMSSRRRGRAARDQFRGRGLCPLRRRAAAGRRRRLLADRLFAPTIHRERIAGMLENYDFIGDDVMAYFKRRLAQAPRDADFALDYVKAQRADAAPSRTPASMRCDSNATCCGRSSTRCITPM